MPTSDFRIDDKRPYLLAAAAGFLMAAALRLQGRVVWCTLGDYRIFASEAWNSGHTSQHLFDPYSLTHVLHGVLFFWLITLLVRNLSIHWRFLVATLIEAGWEIFENTTYVIEKYRANTISLDYFGDSVMNSIGDLAACSVGFWIAFMLGRLWSVAFFALIELILIVLIRDSLIINIIMLVYPVDAIKAWQAGM
jgi:hypothetical protein